MNLLLNRWIIGFTLKYTRGLSSLNTAKFWTLNKAIVLVLIGGFGVLLVEVRFDHRFVVGEDTVGWIPIFYSIMMMVASLIGLFFWRRGGRQVLFVGFLLAIFVGLAGFWFHTNGRLLRSVQHELSAWVRKVPGDEKPPALAPLAFTGLGILGAFACAKRFQPPDSTS
ncbi:MAG: hypothetical protein QOI53_839 [Verrucomicrobiota bacterium]|nr:hypothetical protein [Verrucomicrobiota bacterium]